MKINREPFGRTGRETRGKSAKRILFFFAALILAACLLVSFGRPLGLNVPTWDEIFQLTGLGAPAPADTDAPLRVHFIDVGQGDAALIECGQEKMLIDAGTEASGERVAAYLQKRGIDRLELVVGTHPHEDHIGGLPLVLERIPAGRLLLPETPEFLLAGEKGYADVLDAAEDERIPVVRTGAGSRFRLGEAEVEILSPIDREAYLSLNDVSLCIRVIYGKTSFLFTGDMEQEAEQKLLSHGGDLSATVLKFGHHGGSSASSDLFLRAVNPRCGVISCGAGNDYGHPHERTLERAEKYNIRLYRTDTMGTVVMTSDGVDVTVQCEKGKA